MGLHGWQSTERVVLCTVYTVTVTCTRYITCQQLASLSQSSQNVFPHVSLSVGHTVIDEFLPARRYASVVFARATCLSVHPSVTRRYCVKMKKASVMISSQSGSPTTLDFWRQISSRHSKGFFPSGGLKQGWGGKIQPFSSFKHQYLENGSR